jgi:NDP-sugar pyrophosphorylase family protein
MKALILAAGRGKRLGEITESVNKCMLPLGGKPILEYNLERAAEMDDVTEIILVVGHKAEDIINKYGIVFKNKKIKYVIQKDQKGLVNAVENSKAAIGSDDFFLLLGDEVLVNSRHLEMLKQFKDENLFGVCGVNFQKDKSKISKTYTVLTDDKNRIFRLIEKPHFSQTNWQGTGQCIFKNCLLDYTDRTPLHPVRGEKELPDLIQCAVDDGKIVKIFDLCDFYTNINVEEDLFELKKYFKEK